MSEIAWAFYYAFARERFKRCLISNVFVGNMLPVSYRLGRPAVELML
jgi:hypothetical protein